MNWFPNGSSLSSVLSGNVGTSTYGIKPDNAPSETISGGFGYGTLFAVCGRGDEGYGYGYAIYSGSNATGSRVFATYDRDPGWSERVSKSDSLRISRTYISGDSYADAKNLSIPPGIYSVGPDYKNIPETTYGFLEIVADSINNWRLIKFIPTNIKSYYLMFYNGYDKTWSGWAHFTSVS